jgi:hypothetical protein
LLVESGRVEGVKRGAASRTSDLGILSGLDLVEEIESVLDEFGCIRQL